jgi:hypothetical protein
MQDGFASLVNDFFDAKDYECYCNYVLVKSLENKNNVFSDLLTSYINSSHNEVLQANVRENIRLFIKNSCLIIPIARRLIQMNFYEKDGAESVKFLLTKNKHRDSDGGLSPELK